MPDRALATADTRPCRRALLCPPPAMPRASICHWRGHGDQPARSWCGQVQGKDACTPGRKAAAPKLTAMNLGTSQVGCPFPSPSKVSQLGEQGRKDIKATHRLPFELHNFRFPLHGICVDGRVVGAVGHQLPEPGLLLQLGLHLLPRNRESHGDGPLGGEGHHES